jgi:pimeloyl-ACP methyl ester carboxylesterase
MASENFVVSTPEGEVHGTRSGQGGRRAVMLHGGPGLGDLLEPLADLLAGEFTTIRYQQRGLDPTTIREPYTVEANVRDAEAVLDQAAGGSAWTIGFSWGGYLGLRLLTAIPDRIQGAILIDPLGAYPEAIAEFGENMAAKVPPGLRARLEETDARSDRGEATADEEAWLSEVGWRCYFADFDNAPPRPPWRSNGQCYLDTVASIRTAAECEALQNGLTRVSPRIPVLFVHAACGPMPQWSTTRTAALIPHARVTIVPDAGHFIWYEKPGELLDAITSFLATASAGD